MRELWCRECRKCRQCSEGLSPVGWNSRACILYVQRKRYTTASGYEGGGFSQFGQDPGLLAVSKADLAEIIVWLKSVRAKMNEPVPAQLSYFGRGGLKETMDKYVRALENGVLK